MTATTEKALPKGWGEGLVRWYRPLAVGLSALFALFALVLLVTVYTGVASRGDAGADFVAYRMFGAHFLATGDPYMPAQYVGAWAGPGNQTNLYPPPAILLFAAFTVLPPVLWWAIPLGIVTAITVWWRPAAWTWPVIALILCTVPFSSGIATGNSGMWIMAVIALTTRWPAAGWLLVAKPSEIPLILPWIRHRGWWLGLAVALIVSLVMLPLWFRWLDVLRFYTGPTFLYGVLGWPYVLIPALARFATTRATGAAARAGRRSGR